MGKNHQDRHRQDKVENFEDPNPPEPLMLVEAESLLYLERTNLTL